MKETTLLQIARTVAQQSPCKDKQVGCVITDSDLNIIGTGYNTFIGENNCVSPCDASNCNIIHAEVAALNTVSPRVQPRYAFCTLEPCARCQVYLETQGIIGVYFSTKTSQKNRQCSPFRGMWEYMPISPLVNNRLDLVTMGELMTAYQNTVSWPGEITDQNRIEVARTMALALIVEAQEVLQALPWKPWKPEGYKEPDFDNFVEEMADLFFFMNHLLNIFGLSWAQVEEAFHKKLVENKRRKKDGETI